jgi:hypothetical protein
MSNRQRVNLSAIGRVSSHELGAKNLFAIFASALLTVGAIYFGVIGFQRDLILVALEPVEFYDGVDATEIIFRLSPWQSRVIVRCEDKKHVIEPVINLDDGREAHALSGGFRINVEYTGLLSRPRYLGCPGK